MRRLRLWRMVAYVSLAVAGVVGFWRVEQVQDDALMAQREVARLRIEADRRLCEKLNDANAVVFGLVQFSAGTRTIPPGTSPELAEVLRRADERGQELRAYAAEKLSPVPCETTIIEPKGDG